MRWSRSETNYPRSHISYWQHPCSCFTRETLNLLWLPHGEQPSTILTNAIKFLLWLSSNSASTVEEIAESPSREKTFVLILWLLSAHQQILGLNFVLDYDFKHTQHLIGLQKHQVSISVTSPRKIKQTQIVFWGVFNRYLIWGVLVYQRASRASFLIWVCGYEFQKHGRVLAFLCESTLETSHKALALCGHTYWHLLLALLCFFQLVVPVPGARVWLWLRLVQSFLCGRKRPRLIWASNLVSSMWFQDVRFDAYWPNG